MLFDLLSRTSYVEKAGTGIRGMKDSMKEYGLNVEFESTSFLGLFLRGRKLEKVWKISPKMSPKSFEERKKIIIERVNKGIQIAKRELLDEFGVDVKTIQRNFDKLSNKIRFVGSKKGGHWEVKGLWRIIQIKKMK